MVSCWIFYQKEVIPQNIKSNLGIIFDAINDIEFANADKKIIISIRLIKSAATLDDKQKVDMTAHPGNVTVKLKNGYAIWSHL